MRGDVAAREPGQPVAHDDVWGEVSAGVNFFNFSQTTAVFAKLDVTFGEDVTGLGGKAGMRVSW
ncbi:MAG TPA: hypothetical protein VFD26_12120 [Methyloceanibacter sp.]|nr:hypothetical protein [Methyloceanibacter sp.]